jgi:amidase
VYGLTPTSGRLPYDAKSGMDAIKAVHGPLARSVEGLEVYVQALLSTSPWDWDQATLRMPWRATEYEQGLATHRPLVIGVMRHDGVVLPHPPIQTGLEEFVTRLRHAGHSIVEVAPFKTQEMMDVMFKLFGSEGDRDTQPLQSILDEPLIREIDPPTKEDELSAHEYAQLNRRKLQLRQEFHEHWMAAKVGTDTIDALVMPSGGHVAPPHGSMTYFAYEAISNFLDRPCATFPVGTVLPGEYSVKSEFVPMSAADAENWKKCKCR